MAKQLEGKIILELEDGVKEECTFVNGVKQGEAKIIFLNGDEENYIYVDGVKEGEAFYYDSFFGAKEEYSYVKGVMEGKAIYYWPNGSREERIYKNGEPVKTRELD